ncbi:ATP-binding cassette domain-containing protein [Streptomyces sp. AFD10]|uniref:ATP-binding cassette domain-containing protein n=1 Tax=Streptomyces sp. AFD10 TaxID=3050948 RepID=UPI0034DE608D
MSDNSRAGHRPCDPDAARLRVRDLTVRVDGTVLLDVRDLELHPGITALTGANGAGKSTLLKALATLVPAGGGTITLGGTSTATRKGAAAYRDRIGYLPQTVDFPGHFTVREALAYSAWLRGIPAGKRAEAVGRALADLSLEDAADRQLRQLSGGNRQRVHIAQVLVHEPLLLLLDEPTTGIDSEHRLELRAHLDRISTGRTVVASTHLTEDIELLARHVLTIHDGAVTFHGTPQELITLGSATGADAPHTARAIERGLNAVRSARS